MRFWFFCCRSFVPQIGNAITTGTYSTCFEVHFCQVWAFNKRRLSCKEFFNKKWFFQFSGSPRFLLFFSDSGIVFSGKFYADYICLDIFLSNFLVFYMIFKKLV